MMGQFYTDIKQQHILQPIDENDVGKNERLLRSKNDETG